MLDDRNRHVSLCASFGPTPSKAYEFVWLGCGCVAFADAPQAKPSGAGGGGGGDDDDDVDPLDAFMVANSAEVRRPVLGRPHRTRPDLRPSPHGPDEL